MPAQPRPRLPALLASLHALLLGAALYADPAAAQTPSPLAEWQYAAGIPLIPYFTDEVARWQVEAGFGAGLQPRYEGSDEYAAIGGPMVSIRYRDRAFFSLGEGLGVNLLQGKGYRAGAAIAYDLGRREREYLPQLAGLGNIQPAPEFKLFAERVLCPVVLRANLRHATGGHNGWVSDLSAYMPVTGSKTFFVFVGPSLTFADDEYMQRYFGINAAQSAASAAGYPVYTAGGGLKCARLGSNLTWFFTEHWFLQGVFAYERLYGDAADSPIVQARDQSTASLYAVHSF